MRAMNQNRNGRRRRGLLLLGTVVPLALLLAVAVAAAGQKDKDRSSEPKRAVMLDNEPTQSFVRGTLRRDAYKNWTLDGVQPVLFTHESFVRDTLTGDQEAAPSEGRVAIINGYYVGVSLVVRTCTLLDPFRDQERLGTLDLDASPDASLPIMPARTPQ